ncbi:MAG TPA: hypothetical protein DCG37_08560 [Lachnospiraceae bacterium]|nr:hypothetical protein [Lachnospiraceae bacterium]
MKLKKCFALFLALTMTLSSAPQAFAGELLLEDGEPDVTWVEESIPEIEGEDLDLVGVNSTGWSNDYEHYFYYDDADQLTEAVIDDVVIPPDCVNDGYTIRTAYRIDDVDKENPLAVKDDLDPVAALGHTAAEPVVENEVGPSCNQEGSKDEVVYCSVCGDELSRETITSAMTNHTESDPVVENEVPASCTEAGSHDEVVYCDVCGTELSRKSVTDNALGHTWGEWEETDKATCTKEGKSTRTCTICGETETEVIPVTEHTPGEAKRENVKEASCTEDGSYDEVVYCSICDAEISRETKTVAKNHTWGEWKVTTEPTCTEKGVKTRTCEVCGEEETEEIPAPGHTPKDEPEMLRDETFVAPTCTKDGQHVYALFCSVCGEEISREDPEIEPALGHTPKDAVEENKVEATCTKDGSYDEVIYCDVCGEEISREKKTIEAAHTPGEAVKENEKEATCTEDGSYDEVVYCTVCGEEISRENKVITAPGHTEAEAVKENEVKATCTKDGSYDEVVYCSICGEELSRETKTVDALGHKWELFEGTKIEPTCTKDGSCFQKCSVCGELNETPVVLPALGHTEGEPVNEKVVEATCTKDGSHDEVVYCTVCKEELSRKSVTDAAPGHTPGDVVNEKVVDATCTEAGSHEEVVYCSVCKEEISRVPVTDEALGHDWKEDVVVKAATCEEEGLATKECSRCHEKTNTEKIPALGHDYVKTDIKVTWNADEPDTGVLIYTWTCKNDSSHTKTELVAFTSDDQDVDYTVTKEETKAPTCEEIGETTYTFSETLPDGTVIESKNTEEIPAKGHTAGESVEENVIEATCVKDGSYDSVVYCEDCGKEMTRNTVTSKAKGHEAGEAVEENRVEPTAVIDGHYDTVVYCTICGEELSRETITIPAGGHKPGEAVEENRVEPTCTEKGSYDTVVYCVDESCDPKVELSRKTVSIPAIGHKWAKPVQENRVEAACTEDGGYDMVVYCSVCGEENVEAREHIDLPATGHSAYFTKTGVVEKEATCTEPGEMYDITYCGICFEEISRSDATEIPAAGHIAGETVRENEVAATCTEDGSYDEVVYCAVCGEEISREAKTIEAVGHIEGEAVKENEVAATCTEDGSYDEVVYCTVCKEELSRETKKVEAAGHIEGEAVKENEVAATCTKDGSYDEVVYCTVCKEELSRETKKVEAAGHKFEDGVCTVCGEKMPVTVTFDPANGEDTKEVEYKYGDTAEKLEDPEKDGYIFAFWTLDAEAEEPEEYDFTAPLTEDITLYAYWTAEPDPVITLSETSVDLEKGNTAEITAEMLDTDTIASAESTDEDIASATFTKDAGSAVLTITAGSVEGTATITVTTTAGATAEITVRVLFDDVTDPEEQFYYDAVYWAADNGITTGWDDNTFRPMNDVNRASVVTFLWRLAGKPEPSAMATFSDMTGNEEFDKAISWAAENGIVTGWPNNTFRPWDTCKRAAIVTFIWRYAGKPAATKKAEFKDMTGNEEFDAAISWAAEKGISKGWDEDYTFRPWNTCKRLAVVTFLQRLANL